MLAAGGGGQLKCEQPTSLLGKMDTSSFLKRGSGGWGGGGTRKRAGRERSQVGVSNCLAQDHGQVRG